MSPHPGRPPWASFVRPRPALVRCFAVCAICFVVSSLVGLFARQKPFGQTWVDRACSFDDADIVVLFAPGEPFSHELSFTAEEKLASDAAEARAKSVCANDTSASKCVRTSNWEDCLGRADVVLWDAQELDNHGSVLVKYFEAMSELRRFADRRLYSGSRAEILAETASYARDRFSGIPEVLHSAATKQVWGLLLRDVPGNVEYSKWVTNDYNARLFDLQGTLDWRSDVPFWSRWNFNTSTPIIPFGERRKAVLHLVSNCETPSERETFVAGLKHTFPVESIGRCQHDSEYPPIGRPPSVPESSNFDRRDPFWQVWKEWLSAHYLFDAAFANSLCFSYLDEKIMVPLNAGSVPLVLSVSNFAALDLALANNESSHPAVIFAEQFTSPFALGKYLTELSRDEKAWNRFHEWRRSSAKNIDVPLIPSETQHKVGYEPQKCKWCSYFRAEVVQRQALGERYARRHAPARLECDGSWRQRLASGLR